MQRVDSYNFNYRGVLIVHCEVTGRWYAPKVLDDTYYSEDEIQAAIDIWLD